MPYFPSTLKKINICDVTLRDGLQNIKTVLPTITKLKIIDALVEAGVRDMEVTSFMNPKIVPQLADAAEVYAHACTLHITASVLVANRRGYDRAIEAGCKHVNAVISISESYNKKGFNRTLDESIDGVLDMCASAKKRQCGDGAWAFKRLPLFFRGLHHSSAGFKCAKKI